MKIKLNKRFYDEKAIREALNDFKEVCNGKILNDKIEIELEPKEDIKVLKEEFCNYVLGLMKNKNAV
jgi:hypothetical protein